METYVSVRDTYGGEDKTTSQWPRGRCNYYPRVVSPVRDLSKYTIRIFSAQATHLDSPQEMRLGWGRRFGVYVEVRSPSQIMHALSCTECRGMLRIFGLPIIL
jgi:hypothetical protein